MQNLTLLLQIEEFYQLLQAGAYDYCPDLARALQKLADQAWDDVDTFYQSVIRVD